jgi:hypothetical protein
MVSRRAKPKDLIQDKGRSSRTKFFCNWKRFQEPLVRSDCSQARMHPYHFRTLGFGRVSRATLPAKQYRARKSAEVTPRYFVDRFPIFLNRGSAAAPVPTFTYVDSGAVTVDGFATHLRAYLGLFQAFQGSNFFISLR